MTKKGRSNVGPGKVVVSVYFDKDLHKKLKEIAAKERRSLSNFMRWLAEQSVNKAPSFNQPDLPLDGFEIAA